MVDVSERLKGFDPHFVLSLCRDFLGGPWESATINDFKYTCLNQGFGNRLFVCEIVRDECQHSRQQQNTIGCVTQLQNRRDDNKTGESIPTRILVRFYGGNVLPKNNPIRSLNETTEVLVFHYLGVHGLGPKLYGSFEGGRLEEYIPSVNLSVESFARDAQVNDAIARLIARYHCVKGVPIKKTPWDIPLICSSAIDSYLKHKEDILKNYVPLRFYQTARDFFEFDFIQEIKWIREILPLIDSRVVFAHNDINRSNILVRHDDDITSRVNGSSCLDDHLVLIDYEFSGYNYRGVDIGNHFGMKVFDFGSSSFSTGFDYPSEPFRKRFIFHYLSQARECNEKYSLFPDWDDEGKDSVEHVLMEAEFGCLVRRLTNITGILGGLNNWISICDKRSVIDPVFKNGLIFQLFVNFYRERKRAFLSQWPTFQGHITSSSILLVSEDDEE